MKCLILAAAALSFAGLGLADQYIKYPSSGGSGTVTSITAGTGLTGGTITSSGTVALATPVTVAHGGTGAMTYTAGSVPFYNGSVLSQDNAHFFWDGSSHRLGIGTSTPGYPLQILTGGDIQGLVVKGDITQINNMQEWHKFDNTVLASVAANGFISATGYSSNGGIFALNDSVNGLKYYVNAMTTWTSAGLGAAVDTGLGRNAAGVVEVNNGTLGTFRDLMVRALRLGTFAAASPPVACAAGTDGLVFLSTTYHLCVCNGGATTYVLTSDGTTGCS